MADLSTPVTEAEERESAQLYEHAWRARQSATTERGSVLPPVTPPPLREPDMDWVEATLASLTLDEKIGQMIMPAYTSNSAASNLLSTYDLGGFVFLGTSSSTVINATNSLQGQADIPLLFSIDCEAGSGARLTDGTKFPMNMGLAASRRTDLAFEQGVITARECRALGIHIGLGPVLDVNNEPINPIIGIRSFSDQPALVEMMAREYVRGAASAGMLTTYKHYPGHGATEGDSHQTLPVVNITCDELQATHVRPYRTLIGEGTGDVVMTAHVWYPCLDPGPNATPGTISVAALRDILRDDLQYDRLLMSDAFRMEGLQVVGSTFDAVQISVMAGLDIVLMPTTVNEAVSGIKAGIDGGTITLERIDQSVRRILIAKSKVGLPEAAIVSASEASQTLFHPDHVEVAKEIGADALVMKMGGDGVLPVGTSESILCLPFLSSSSIFYLFPYTAFTAPLQAAFPNATIRAVGTGVSSGERAQIVTQAASFDRVIITSRMWRPNDSSGQRQLVNDLIAAGADPIYISFGSPYHIFDTPDLDHYIVGFSSHDGTQEAAVELLQSSGRLGPGKWPVSIFGVETGYSGLNTY